MKWSFYQIWNESLEKDKSKSLTPRNHIWAMEIGGAFIDRYLKMKAIPPTNPPNARSKRKFEAGNIWEAIVGYVLYRAGILQKRQEWLAYQYPNLLKVTGKLDYIAGGVPDYEKATSIIQREFEWLPKFISTTTLNIVTKLQEKFPNGLEDIILEIKSCSSFMFEKYENTGASPHHKLQLFHYLKSKNMPEGHIVYVCRDDARLLEIGVLNPSPVENEYIKDIRAITTYLKQDVCPPTEKPIEFDEKFYANWKVGYSQYLTYLYDMKDQNEFDNRYRPMVEKWNRVLTRIKENKKMTDNNLEAIEEMKKFGFDIKEIKKELEDDKPRDNPKT